jgi:clan AA aspartic protease
MKGYINSFGDPVIGTTIIGSRGRIKVIALIDTGFSGAICIPVKLAIQLGLELISEVTVEYADGTRKDELVFNGKIVWDRDTKDVEIYLTRSEEVLIGKELFNDGVLEINFKNNTVLFRRLQ